MRDDAARRLRMLYAEVDAELAARGWTCRACGKCCRFEEFGHELFCSEIEAEYLVSGGGLPDIIDARVCPFMDVNVCTRRMGRTLACRTYFCDGALGEEMAGFTERYVSRLKALHGELDMGWRYGRLVEHLEVFKSKRRKG